MTKLTNPFPLFLDARGALLDAGHIYVGVSGADPEAQPIAVFWDVARTIPALQPLRTQGGVIVNGATPSGIYFAENDYSLRVRDADNDLISYVPSAVEATQQYQPMDSDLTAIAALSTTAFGRGLLTLAGQAALKAATGIPDCLPLIGGTVSGNVLRQGAGGVAYAMNAGAGAVRIFGPEYTTDPTSQLYDVWFKANG